LFSRLVNSESADHEYEEIVNYEGDAVITNINIKFHVREKVNGRENILPFIICKVRKLFDELTKIRVKRVGLQLHKEKGKELLLL